MPLYLCKKFVNYDYFRSFSYESNLYYPPRLTFVKWYISKSIMHSTESLYWFCTALKY